jgi:2-(1,2-epoxy-1,2-dihydrophenyl)acetyl-CoA isomerase
MSFQDIEVSARDGVAIVTLTRPDRLNAYTPDMGEELVTAIRAQLADDAVRAIVLTGAGRGFCAGADRDVATGQRGRFGYRLGEEPFLRGFAAELAQAEKPTIAAINGPAVGLGATMTLPFDFRIASEGASFGFPFARLGLMPGMGATFLLPHLVGRTAARRILLSGASLDAAEALRAGLVSEVVAPGDLLPRALALAASLTGKDARIIAALKRVLNAVDQVALAAAIAREQAEISRLAERQEVVIP